jgi:hypothetical protein
MRHHATLRPLHPSQVSAATARWLASAAAALLLAPAAPCGDEPLFRSPIVDVSSKPKTVAAADLDQDGDTDLVTGFTANLIGISLQTAPGTYALQSGTAIATGPTLSRLALADLNGDGAPDLLYTVSGAGSLLVVHPGNGAGSFGAALPHATAGGPTDIGLADLDADGDLDALVTCPTGQRLSVLLGHGDGSFAPKLDLAAGTVPLEVATGDWNGDGAPDAAVADNGAPAAQHRLTVLLNDGRGALGSAATIPLPEQVYDVETGDFDGDGRADLAVSVAASAHVLVLAGNGDGSFGAPQVVPGLASGRQLVVADADEDGDADLAQMPVNGASRLVALMLGDGAGGFAPPRLTGTLTSPQDLLVQDVTDDGDLDLLVPGSEFIFGQWLTLLPGNGRGDFSPVAGVLGDNCPDVAFGALDGDARPDMVAASVLNDTVTVYRGEGSGFVRAVAGLHVDAFPGESSRPLSVALGDLDGDGAGDVVAGVSGLPPRLALHFGDGDLGFDPVLALPLTGVPADVLLADLEGDGDLDLLATGNSTASLSVVRNLGSRSFAAPELYATSALPSRLAVADMNGDAVLDVIASTGGATITSFVHVFLGLGDGTLEPALSFAGGTNHGGLAVADVDGDLDPDVAVSELQSGNALLLLNDGTGFLSAPVVLPTGGLGNVVGVVLADLDRDGVPDLAAAGSSTQPFTGLGGLAFFRGSGGGAFEPPVRYPLNAGASNLTGHDIDGDGALDLAAPSIYDFVELLLNQLGPWNDLGHPLAGALGLPKQVGEGSLQPLSPFRFTLSDSRPAAAVAHVVGLAALNAPFKGGVYVPLPQLVNFPLLTDGTGELVLAGAWPAGAGGLTLYLQFWWKDPAGPAGYASSNAVSASVPAR